MTTLRQQRAIKNRECWMSAFHPRAEINAIMSIRKTRQKA